MNDDHPLDGKYLVTSTSSYQTAREKKSDGETEIRNSQTERLDEANCKWTSTFTIISETEVKMVSVADPTDADGDFLLTNEHGSPTRQPQTYEGTLKLARKGDRVQMSGEIKFGHDVVFLTLRKIGD